MKIDFSKIDFSKWVKPTIIPVYKFGKFYRNIKVPTNLIENYINGYNEIDGDDCGPNGIFRNYLRERFNISQGDNVYIHHECFNFMVEREEFGLYISNELESKIKEN